MAFTCQFTFGWNAPPSVDKMHMHVQGMTCIFNSTEKTVKSGNLCDIQPCGAIIDRRPTGLMPTSGVYMARPRSGTRHALSLITGPMISDKRNWSTSKGRVHGLQACLFGINNSVHLPDHSMHNIFQSKSNISTDISCSPCPYSHPIYLSHYVIHPHCLLSKITTVL
ncbi:hypothetical protein VTN96DRAFT_10463 [Rasamsonia emersonii]